MSVNAIKRISATSYMDFINAWSEENNYEDAVYYKDGTDNEVDDVKVYKIGSVLLVDGGAAFTSMNDSIELENSRKVKGTRLEYADGSVGKELKKKGNFMLNGHSSYSLLLVLLSLSLSLSLGHHETLIMRPRDHEWLSRSHGITTLPSSLVLHKPARR